MTLNFSYPPFSHYSAAVVGAALLDWRLWGTGSLLPVPGEPGAAVFATAASPAGVSFAFDFNGNLPVVTVTLAAGQSPATLGHIFGWAQFQLALAGGGTYQTVGRGPLENSLGGTAFSTQFAAAFSFTTWDGLTQLSATDTISNPNPLLGENWVQDRRIASWTWSFGDGGTATTSVPTAVHEYLDYGDYEVALLLTDSLGYEALAAPQLPVLVRLLQGAVCVDPNTGAWLAAGPSPVVQPGETDGSGAATVIGDQDTLVLSASLQNPAPQQLALLRQLRRPALWRGLAGGELGCQSGGALYLAGQSAVDPYAWSVYQSADEGITFAMITANVWSSAYVALHFEPLIGGGAISLAQAGGQLFSSVSHDASHWEPPVLVGEKPPTSGRFCLRQLHPAGLSTLIITDSQTATFTSEDYGTTWTQIYP